MARTGRALGSVCIGLLTGAMAWGQGAPPNGETDSRPETRVQRAYEARADSLSRLWARVVFELKFKDADGAQRSEQGEGHLQFLGPDRLALTLGKVGQRVLYLGCDRERFWFIDMTDGGRAHIGRNANVGKPCMEESGLPAHPTDVLWMLGVSALPEGASGRVGGGVGEARLLAATPTGRLRITASVERGEPSRIELLPATADESASWAGVPTIVASLSEYGPVEMRGGGAPARLPKKIVMEARASEMTLTLWLYDPVRGAERQLPEEAFDLDFLLDALGPTQVRWLDEACEASISDSVPPTSPETNSDERSGQGEP